MNRENLTILADYLDALPDDYDRFEMSVITSMRDREAEADYCLHNGGVRCNATACALGHGPAAGLLFLEPDFKNPDHMTRWDAYSRRVFGFDSYAGEWDFLFGGGWSGCDNTIRGAAARIRCLLAGRVPKVWDYDPSLYAAYLSVPA